MATERQLRPGAGNGAKKEELILPATMNSTNHATEAAVNAARVATTNATDAAVNATRVVTNNAADAAMGASRYATASLTTWTDAYTAAVTRSLETSQRAYTAWLETTFRAQQLALATWRRAADEALNPEATTAARQQWQQTVNRYVADGTAELQSETRRAFDELANLVKVGQETALELAQANFRLAQAGINYRNG